MEGKEVEGDVLGADKGKGGRRVNRQGGGVACFGGGSGSSDGSGVLWWRRW